MFSNVQYEHVQGMRFLPRSDHSCVQSRDSGTHGDHRADSRLPTAPDVTCVGVCGGVTSSSPQRPLSVGAVGLVSGLGVTLELDQLLHGNRVWFGPTWRRQS